MKINNVLGKVRQLSIEERKQLESFYSEFGEERIPVRLDGQVIGYRSNRLNDEFKKSIQGNNIFSSSAKNKIFKAIDGKNIIPVYTSFTWLGDLFDTFFRIFINFGGYILGFYDGQRIVLMVANLRDISGRIPQKEMYGIVTHEQQHMFAGEKSNYHKDPLVKKILREWYSNFIDIYFENKLSDINKKKLINFWTQIKLEYTTNNIGDLIWRRIREFDTIAQEVEKSEVDSSVKRLMVILYQYLEQLYSGNYFGFDMNPLTAGRKAYLKIGVTPDTLIFQEFVIPSEVICVAASNHQNWGNQFLSKYL